ncbi:MAG: hypothetical protein KKB21_02270 [Nanoarchaeota archaeon]|nr:hypothetical protein [Nanoarchaeota archaeon]MBU4086381.1 hypothetical protein [Nanoarchaeota archaeon]
MREFILDLPSAYDLEFYVSTPQYSRLIRRAVSRGESEEEAVRNYLHPKFRDKNVPRRILSALRGRVGGLESCAFSVPENLDLKVLADEIARKRAGVNAEQVAGELIEFYKSYRER